MFLINKRDRHLSLMLLVSGEDFIALSARLPFTGCQNRSCINVTILNDERVEPLTEQFSVSLETAQEGLGIIVISEPSRIVILDDDGMFSFQTR